MEGSKNAMYAQAGRSRGWSQGMQENMPPNIAVPAQPVVPMTSANAVPAIPEPPVVVMPAQPVVPMTSAKAVPTIPEPPVAVMPVRPVVEAPAAELPDIMIPAKASVEVESNTMYMQMPEHMHYSKDCETPVMAYVPMQKWGDLYDSEQGFSRGTIFTTLDLPFIGEGACRYE